MQRVLAVLLIGLGPVVIPTAPAGAQAEPTLPIVFVHGFSGSAQQYETQALRWASNDYPNVVTAVERSTAFHFAQRQSSTRASTSSSTT